MNRSLTVLFSDNGVFSDLSAAVADYGRDTAAIAMVAAEDYLYLGLDKAFGATYVQMGTVASAAGTFTVEYWNGTSWTALTPTLEDTKGFSRSGFIRWDKKALVDAGWVTYTVNSLSRFWIRLQPAVSLTGSPTLQGVSIVFASDEDLKKKQADIMKYLPRDEINTLATSFILQHEAARDWVITEIKRDGVYKISSSTGSLKDLDGWDFHEIDQVKQAAIYAALGFAFEQVAASDGDLAMQKAELAFSRARKCLDVPLLSVDLNDDGEEAANEETGSWDSGILTRGR